MENISNLVCAFLTCKLLEIMYGLFQGIEHIGKDYYLLVDVHLVREHSGQTKKVESAFLLFVNSASLLNNEF